MTGDNYGPAVILMIVLAMIPIGIIAFAVTHPWVLLAVPLWVAVMIWRDGRAERRRLAELEAARRARLIADADEQHAQVLRGDKRGWYGRYPAAVAVDFIPPPLDPPF